MHARIDGAAVAVTVRGTITDGETVSLPNDRRMVVDRFEAIVTADDGGWKCGSVKVYGKVLNGDGRPGRREATVRFFAGDPDAPLWVPRLISSILPLQGPPAFTDGRFGLDGTDND